VLLCPARFSVWAHGQFYVDIDPRTYNIDPLELERRVTSRSKVIVAQHTFGIPCDMEPIMETAQRHGLASSRIPATCGGRNIGPGFGLDWCCRVLFLRSGKPFIIGMGGAATVNSEGLRPGCGTLLSASGSRKAVETAKAAPSICRSSPDPASSILLGRASRVSVAVEERGGDRDLDQRTRLKEDSVQIMKKAYRLR